MEFTGAKLNSKTFCMAPWVHLHTWPDGKVFPCCMTPMQNPVGDLRKEKLKEIWNGAEMRALRGRMLRGERSLHCVRCYELEDAGSMNLRLDLNRDYGGKIDRLRATTTDGNLETFELGYLDFRFSNLCNFRCRTCGPQLSSSWAADHTQLHGARDDFSPGKVMRPFEDLDRFWSEIEPHLDYVEEIYFAGGEPLLMPEHYRVLRRLSERRMFGVRLKYNTNFSRLTVGSENVLDYWKRFENVKVLASLDGEAKRGEYLRKGQEWGTTVKNRLSLQEVCPHVDFRMGPTVSAFNVWHLPDFHRSWVEKGWIGISDITLNLLMDPEHYQTRVLPSGFKDELMRKYEKHAEWIQDSFGKAGVLAVSGFKSVMNFTVSKDVEGLWSKFKSQTRKLDEIRGEKLADAFPELEKWVQ